METVKKIIAFAEQIAKEDNEKMKKIQDWEAYIEPLFKEHTGYEFNLAYISMYKKDWLNWLNLKRKQFEKNYIIK